MGLRYNFIHRRTILQRLILLLALVFYAGAFSCIYYLAVLFSFYLLHCIRDFLPASHVIYRLWVQNRNKQLFSIRNFDKFRLSSIYVVFIYIYLYERKLMPYHLLMSNVWSWENEYIKKDGTEKIHDSVVISHDIFLSFVLSFSICKYL